MTRRQSGDDVRAAGASGSGAPSPSAASEPWPGGWRRWYSPDAPVRIGVSACLLGDAVRYDGGHKRDSALDRALGPWAQWVRVCPEVEAGMGVPRPPVRLEERDGGLRMVDPASGRDHTEPMTRYARRRTRALGDLELDGYVLKSRSPSCGLGSARVFRRSRSGEEWVGQSGGTGLFALELRRACPDLPLAEEGDLQTASLAKAFLETVFARNRWRALATVAAPAGAVFRLAAESATTSASASRPVAESAARLRSRLVAFHTAHKFVVWARDEGAVRRLGRLLGGAGRLPDDELAARYGSGFLAAMSTPATRERHVNVLQHAQGYVKRLLAPEKRRALHRAVDDYRLGRAPWSVPADLLRRCAARHRVRYLLDQLYFDSAPRLRSFPDD